MFSVDNFYNILQTNLLRPLSIHNWHCHPFGTFNIVEDNDKQSKDFYNERHIRLEKLVVLFYDQEPFFETCYKQQVLPQMPWSFGNRLLERTVFAVSEHSSEIDSVVKQSNGYKWYFFFHGLAALDWYRDLRYFNNLDVANFTHLFITVNRIVTQDRSYRLALVADIHNRGLANRGLISCNLGDRVGGTWKQEIFNPESKLSVDNKKLIAQVFPKFDKDLILDFEDTPGYASALLDEQRIKMFSSAFVHLVTETIFYQEKQHLTEKIFRPIVLQRPFILAGAYKNLEYLKGYGFKTFDRWWDESYDLEPDPNIRTQKIVDVLEQLSKLSDAELKQMHQEMLPILQYNKEHFYTTFKDLVIDEMIDNFETVCKQFNNGNLHPLPPYEFNKLKIALKK